ncbi:MAG: AAA family ATPase [Acidimicrobiales bacterium]
MARKNPPSTNPFHYGSPVMGDQFVGRSQEVAAVESRIRSHVNVVLVSPRRYGKSSLLAQVEQNLTPAKLAIVHVDLLRCKDLSALAGVMTSQLFHVPGARWARMRQAMPEFLRRLRVRPSVTLDEKGLPRFDFGPRLVPSDADQIIADVYELLEEVGRARPAALVLDEFQAIIQHGEHLPNLLKGLSDEHPGVSLVMAGSSRHMMERLVLDEKAPLYGMAQRIGLGELPRAEVMTFLRARAAVGQKAMTEEAAELIVDTAGPVPNDVQHLAYETFDAAGDVIDVRAVREGFLNGIDHEVPIYSDRYQSRAPGQRRVLVELAKSGGTSSPTSAAFAAAVGLATGASARKAMKALGDDELAIERNGKWVVSDPFFAGWLRGFA